MAISQRGHLSHKKSEILTEFASSTAITGTLQKLTCVVETLINNNQETQTAFFVKLCAKFRYIGRDGKVHIFRELRSLTFIH